MKARTPEELGEQLRHALWRFTAATSFRGVARDKAAVALVRSRYPAARDVFSDQAIAAAIREVTDGTCHFCALRVVTAAADVPMPTEPTPALVALLGQPCVRCQGEFAAGEVADRERRLLASGMRRRFTGPPAGLTAAARRAPGQRRTTPDTDADRCPCEQCRTRRPRRG